MLTSAGLEGQPFQARCSTLFVVDLKRAVDAQDLRGRRARIREGRSGMGLEGRRLARTRRGDRPLPRLGLYRVVYMVDLAGQGPRAVEEWRLSFRRDGEGY